MANENETRCAVCGWPCYADILGCRPGNCSMRPLPQYFTDPDRAIAEGYSRELVERHRRPPPPRCPECERLRKALEAVEALLALGERMPQEDPDFGAMVRALGEEIGFGAMMSSAQASWRKHLIERGHPPGGEHAVVGCYAAVVKALEQTRSAIARAQ